MSVRLILVLQYVLFMVYSTSAQSVEVKDNFFFLDGQKFFIKGIGYEVGATPGVLPWAHTFNADIMRADIERILSGGFNTIRTWAPFTAEELTLLSEYDLKIIMGIWIDPHGDFSDPAFVSQARSIVNGVLSYSRGYDNIIAYLIMNEPLPETVTAAGYPETEALWSQLIDLIHAQHPGRPVSIANTCNGTYINPEIFDFSAFNVYIYNPVMVNALHGYRDYVDYLTQLNVPGHPLVISEYGLSVSPGGPGNWGYGGNSLTEQQEGVLHMYRALVNGGAAGSCVFNYSDGWWKGGDEFVHDNSPEEWFGLVGYNSLADQYGQERPVWQAVKAFQSAIVTAPRSAEIYPQQVPVEIFPDDTIARMEIYRDGFPIVQRPVSAGYIVDTLFFSVPDLTDVILVFRFFDAHDNLIKEEEKSILLTPEPVPLPHIHIEITDDDYWDTGTLPVRYQISRGTIFTTSSDLDYIYYPHVGFDYGEKYVWTMPNLEEVDFSRQHGIAPNVHVITVGAAFDMTYGTFRKRIVNQLTVSRINAVLNSLSDQAIHGQDPAIVPNPANTSITLFDPTGGCLNTFSYTLFNVNGTRLRGGVVSCGTSLDVSDLSPGLYCIEIGPDTTRERWMMRFIKG